MRKQIDQKSTRNVGYIKKTHGVQGELLVAFDDEINEDLTHLEFLYFEIEGLIVPFFIDKIIERSNGTLCVKFNNIDSKEKATEFVGCLIAVESDQKLFDDSTFNLQQLVGFTLVDKAIGVVGEVVDVNDFGGNIVLTVNYHSDEVMIPFNEDLMLSFDEETLTLVMECPDGIFDLSE